MHARKAEALDTLVAEGVRVESVFLESHDDGDFLVYYMRAKSMDEAARIAARSAASIDAFHQAFKRDTWMEVKRLELLVDWNAGSS